MKKSGKIKFLIVFILIVLFTYVTFFGLSIDNYYGDTSKFHFGVRSAKDIRWGIDISGGVEAVFTPDIDPKKVTNDNMDAAKKIIETRLVNKNITDYEVFADYDNHQVIVRFPQSNDKDKEFDPQAVVDELGQTAKLAFYKNNQKDDANLVLTGDDVAKAEGGFSEENGYVVYLTLKRSGVSAFSRATGELAASKGTIAIYMDDTLISNPTVNSAINDKNCIIEGMENMDAANDLAGKINAGALPFTLSVDNNKLQIITPTLGSEALQVMLIAAIIAFVIICLLMIFKYRLCGIITCVGLVGQAAGMVACVSGFFDSWNSFTLTIPGIAGMILSIGMGVDANVITNERIREEFRNGKTIDSAIEGGYANAFSAILDGNITNVLVAIVLMGAFGTTDGIFYKLFSPILRFFNGSITGSVYSFGYTLLAGVIVNFIMAVFACRIMNKGISKFKVLRKPWLYGGAKNEKV